MTKWITASAEYGLRTSRAMDPRHPGARTPGIARAFLHVYEPGDDPASDTLPTVADLLASADPQTGIISIERYVGSPLRIHASALAGLAPDSRVGPGESFLTDEALAAAPGASTS